MCVTFSHPLSFLHTRLRTATLRHDADGQAVLLNLLLRNYLHFNLYDQAEKLVSKSVFPELANNNEWARYLYYTGKTETDTQVRLTPALFVFFKVRGFSRIS